VLYWKARGTRDREVYEQWWDGKRPRPAAPRDEPRLDPLGAVAASLFPRVEHLEKIGRRWTEKKLGADGKERSEERYEPVLDLVAVRAVLELLDLDREQWPAVVEMLELMFRVSRSEWRGQDVAQMVECVAALALALEGSPDGDGPDGVQVES
jgi:hypothetical protein